MSKVSELFKTHFKKFNIEIKAELKSENLLDLLEELFPSKVISLDSESIDDVSVYLDILRLFLKAVDLYGDISEEVIVTSDLDGKLDYNEASCQFEYDNKIYNIRISDPESDYLCENFLKNLIGFINDKVIGDLVGLSTDDQWVEYVYLPKGYGKVFLSLIESDNWKALKSEKIIAASEVESIEIEKTDESNVVDNLQSALLEAIIKKRIPKIKALIILGADPFKADENDVCPFWSACYRQPTELPKILIELSENVDQKWISFAFMEAAFAQDLGFMKWLAEHYEPNPDVAFAGGSVLTHMSYSPSRNDIKNTPPIDDERFRIVQFLLRLGSRVDGLRNDAIGSPMERAIIAGDFRLMDELLSFGAKLTSTKVMVAVNWVAYEGNYEVIKYLLDNGLKPNPKKSKNKIFAAPIHYAIQRGHKDIVSKLIEKGSKLDYKANYSPSNVLLQHHFIKLDCLTTSIKYKQPEILKLLIESGLSPDGESEMHRSIIWASLLCDYEAIKVLIDAGVDVNYFMRKEKLDDYDYDNGSPIYYAIEVTALDICNHLNAPEDVIIFMKKNGAKSILELEPRIKEAAFEFNSDDTKRIVSRL